MVSTRRKPSSRSTTAKSYTKKLMDRTTELPRDNSEETTTTTSSLVLMNQNMNNHHLNHHIVSADDGSNEGFRNSTTTTTEIDIPTIPTTTSTTTSVVIEQTNKNTIKQQLPIKKNQHKSIKSSSSRGLTPPLQQPSNTTKRSYTKGTVSSSSLIFHTRSNAGNAQLLRGIDHTATATTSSSTNTTTNRNNTQPIPSLTNHNNNNNNNNKTMVPKFGGGIYTTRNGISVIKISMHTGILYMNPITHTAEFVRTK